VLYLRDHDWQGHEIAATRRRLEKAGPIDEWERLALTEEQVEEHDLARLTIRKADKRYRPIRYHDAIETEALSQTIIVNIVRERLDELLPEPLEDVLRTRAASARRRDPQTRGGIVKLIAAAIIVAAVIIAGTLIVLRAEPAPTACERWHAN
jgi:hypothetical protein